MSSTETPEFIKMVGRMIRAAGKRVADADDVDLAQLAKLRGDVDDAIQVAVDGMLARGESWAYIGRAVGTSRQAAQMRYGKAGAKLSAAG